jgi:AraC-like DNA-binding protein
METLFRTDDLPVNLRFESWYETARQAHAPHEVSTDHAGDFHATLGIVELGPVQLCTMTYPTLTARRTTKLIRQADPELYQLSVLVRGRLGIAQAGRDAALRPQNLVLSDSSRPYHGWATAEDGVAVARLQLPRSLLSLPEGDVDRLTATCMSGREGIGALVTGFLTRLATDPTRYRPADAARLGTIAVDLVSALLAQYLDEDGAPTAGSHRRALLLRIQAFVHEHLDDPGLNPGVIAAAHHISTRYLHRLFQQEGSTVAGWIRRRRLDRCRRDLGDPALGARPIHTIAARWGFLRPADFSRAFRAAYGIAPREYRELALREVYAHRE